MAKLLIGIKDIVLLSGFDGNIDDDTIKPFIFMAQNTEIKRILGVPLYDKIVDDYNNKALVEPYLNVYTNYVAIIESYYTCALYLRLGIPKVSQNGAYLVTPEKTEQIWNDRTDGMADQYQKLAVGLELQLVDLLEELNLPERPNPSDIQPKSNFNWIRVK